MWEVVQIVMDKYEVVAGLNLEVRTTPAVDDMSFLKDN